MSFEKSSNFLRFLSSGEFKAVTMPTYRFKSFVLSLSERQLISGESPVPLTPKVFDTLVYLVERAGHLVEKEKIMLAVWPDTTVEEGNLARSIHTLRKTFAQVDGDYAFIETVPTKGYRFVAPVEKIRDASFSHSPTGQAETSLANPISSSYAHRFLGAVRRRPILCMVTAIVAAVLLVLPFTSFDSFVVIRSLARKTNNGLAYREFQEGKYLLDRRLGPNDRTDALAHFEKALKADPNFVDAIAGTADARILIFWNTHKQVDIIKARDLIEQALTLDEENAYAHSVKCRLLATYDAKLDRAEVECRRAIELDPYMPEAYRELGFLLDSVARDDEAIESMRIAASLETTSFNLRSVGVVLYHSRRYDEALEQFMQITATDPEYIEVLKWMSWAYEMKGDEQNAFNAFIKQLQAKGTDQQKVREMREIFDRDGWKGILRARVDEREASSQLIDACDLAQLGETDRAFNVLEQIYQRRAVMSTTIAREPRLDPIRTDPRFAEHLRRSGLK